MEAYKTIKEKKNDTPSIKDWIIWLLLLSIPIVNIVLMIIWAIDSEDKNPVRSNFCKAQIVISILWMAIIMIYLLIFIGISTFSFFNN